METMFYFQSSLAACVDDDFHIFSLRSHFKEQGINSIIITFQPERRLFFVMFEGLISMILNELQHTAERTTRKDETAICNEGEEDWPEILALNLSKKQLERDLKSLKSSNYRLSKRARAKVGIVIIYWKK